MICHIIYYSLIIYEPICSSISKHFLIHLFQKTVSCSVGRVMDCGFVFSLDLISAAKRLWPKMGLLVKKQICLRQQRCVLNLLQCFLLRRAFVVFFLLMLMIITLVGSIENTLVMFSTQQLNFHELFVYWLYVCHYGLH